MPTTDQPRTVLVVTLTPVHMGVDYHQVGGGPTTIEVYYADPIDTTRTPHECVDGYIVSDSTGEIRGVVSEGAANGTTRWCAGRVTTVRTRSRTG